MENIVIRSAKREELDAVNKIRKQVNDIHVNGRSDIFREDGWQFIELFIYSRFDEENSDVIVAAIEDEIVGFAGIKIILDQADIMNIVVKKSFRNQGIGKLLLEHLISIAETKKITSIMLEVNENNLFAIKLYTSLGFETISIRKNYYNDKDGLIMKKSINN